MAAPTPNILVISLDYSDIVQKISAHLFTALRSRSNLIIATTTDDAMKALTTLFPRAVLLTDPTLTTRKLKPASRALDDALANYVLSGGGRVILCGMFISNVSWKDFNEWILRRWGLPWQFGHYHGAEFFLNPEGKNLCRMPGLVEKYHMKVVSLIGVAEEAKIYHEIDNSWTLNEILCTMDSEEFAESIPPKDDLAQAAVAMEKVGLGWLGYLGDVNSDEKSTPAVLAMCGLPGGEECYVCEKLEKEMPALLCARCKKASYCSKECQKGDWKRHKVVCRD
jgi:hypothetical protein